MVSSPRPRRLARFFGCLKTERRLRTGGDLAAILRNRHVVLLRGDRRGVRRATATQIEQLNTRNRPA